MSRRIISPDFSFVRFAVASEEQAYRNTLPVYLNTDLKFQFFIDCDTIVEADAVLAESPDHLRLVLLEARGYDDDSDLISGIIYDFTTAGGKTFELVRISDYTIALLWEKDLVNLPTHIDCDQCFRLGLNIQIGATNYRRASNTFYRSCSSKNTSLIEYANDENVFGFAYCTTGFTNRARIRMNLTEPQLPEEESVYNRSDGGMIITSSSTRQEYNCVTDHYQFELHKAIKAALSHETVNVTHDDYTGGLRKNGSYDIGWTGNRFYKRAPAEFKAYATPFIMRMDNCDECDEYLRCPDVDGIEGTAELIEGCSPVNFVGSLSLPPAVIGTSYYHELFLAGNPDFDLTLWAVPTWMTVTIAGNMVQLSGTVTGPAELFAVEFRVINCEESNSVEFSQNLEIYTVPPAAILRFKRYTAGEFEFELLPPHPIAAIEIIGAKVFGYNGATCSGTATEDNLTPAVNVTIPAGLTTGSGAGTNPFGIGVIRYKKVNQIEIDGHGILANGDTFTLAGTTVTVEINTACLNYAQ